MIKNGLKALNNINSFKFGLSRNNKYFDNFKSKLPIKNRLSDNVEYFEQETKHRNTYKLYDLIPMQDFYSFVAPNATLLGSVVLDRNSSVGYNTVIRGDINEVTIGRVTTIGDHCVIHTASSLPTGLPASVSIGDHNIIQNRVTMYSCTTEKNVFIGHGSVILEGAVIETGAVVLPNSVVPPGRIIPAHQIWGGNPVEFVRDLKASEVFSNYANCYSIWQVVASHKETFSPTNFTYLDRESTQEDLDIASEDQIYTENRTRRDDLIFY